MLNFSSCFLSLTKKNHWVEILIHNNFISLCQFQATCMFTPSIKITQSKQKFPRSAWKEMIYDEEDSFCFESSPPIANESTTNIVLSFVFSCFQGRHFIIQQDSNPHLQAYASFLGIRLASISWRSWWSWLDDATCSKIAFSKGQ